MSCRVVRGIRKKRDNERREEIDRIKEREKEIQTEGETEKEIG